MTTKDLSDLAINLSVLTSVVAVLRTATLCPARLHTRGTRDMNNDAQVCSDSAWILPWVLVSLYSSKQVQSTILLGGSGSPGSWAWARASFVHGPIQEVTG